MVVWAKTSAAPLEFGPGFGLESADAAELPVADCSCASGELVAPAEGAPDCASAAAEDGDACGSTEPNSPIWDGALEGIVAALVGVYLPSFWTEAAAASDVSPAGAEVAAAALDGWYWPSLTGAEVVSACASSVDSVWVVEACAASVAAEDEPDSTADSPSSWSPAADDSLSALAVSFLSWATRTAAREVTSVSD